MAKVKKPKYEVSFSLTLHDDSYTPQFVKDDLRDIFPIGVSKIKVTKVEA